ncbi:MAG TPA: STAS domain-containing protein [Chthoniobacteraceae bacterium]|jgi:anti-anti-sigma factor
MPLDINITRKTDSPHHTTLNVDLGGSLDTATAPELEKQLNATLVDEVKDLIFNLANLTFISSAGLRVFAATRKLLKQRGEQVSFVNLQPQVKEVFEIVKALPGVSVFANVAEFDTYLAARQRKIVEGE